GRPTAPDRARSKAERDARRAERRRGRDPRDRSTPGERRAGQMFESPPEARYPTGTPARIPVDGQFSDRGGTVSLWLDPAWGGTSQDDAGIVKIGDGTLRLVKNVTFIRFEAMDPNGHVDGVGIPIGDWQPGQWRFLSVTWDSGTIS